MKGKCPWYYSQLSRDDSPVIFPQVRILTEEVHSLNEEVSKLTRAVRAAQEAQQQTQDHLHKEEEKLSNMSKASLKLGQQIDAVSSSGLTSWQSVFRYFSQF